MALQRTLSEKFHFRTCTLHYLHPSLQAWYRAWHISGSCWKLECNCQFKLIQACIIKELVIYTDESDVSHHLTDRHNFPLFFFSCCQENTALNRGLVYDHFSWEPAVCELLLLESAKLRFVCIKFRVESWGCAVFPMECSWVFTASLHPRIGWGGCSLGFVTLLCRGSHLPFDQRSPLAFERWQWGQFENCLDEVKLYFLQNTVLPHAGCPLYFA